MVCHRKDTLSKRFKRRFGYGCVRCGSRSLDPEVCRRCPCPRDAALSKVTDPELDKLLRLSGCGYAAVEVCGEYKHLEQHQQVYHWRKRGRTESEEEEEEEEEEEGAIDAGAAGDDVHVGPVG